MIVHALKRLFGGRPPGGIRCQEALARINEFMDGELDPSEAPSVEEHFKVCTRCYPHLKLEREFRSRLQSALQHPRVPDQLRNRVLQILASERREDPDAT
ncbi:MAG: zf-HC2 domain-containing protein [Longimicrobiales bacterium]|nr:zf-HC2 domain-containing protein [Longimicrobiales bacterium]